ncbi:Osteocrin [Merluccius polli]|uniref:Osteocrin n=1 Tax=Merluccius polli TaxID=89951 RepID=A0AA47MI25_MERPO|nr:Osteocrin [Merluccius polli]
MLVCVWLLLPCLLSVNLLPHSDALRSPPGFTHYPGLRPAPHLGPHPQSSLAVFQVSVTVLPGCVSGVLLSYLAVFQVCYSLTWLCFRCVTVLPGCVSGVLLSYLAVFQVPGLQSNLAGPSGVQKAREMSEKLLLLDHLVRMENDVIEPKRKRSFPGGNTPIDRLSISVMDTKQSSNKSGVAEAENQSTDGPNRSQPATQQSGLDSQKHPPVDRYEPAMERKEEKNQG